VPIHKALIDEGFLSYVESQEDKLFDGLNAESFTKWFFEFRESLGIERYNDFNHRKVFHSFRHSFITKSRGAGNEGTKVQQVIGHEKLHFGVTDRYTHDYDLYQVLDVIDKVSYTD
jgi:site-specific recombinase XerD